MALSNLTRAAAKALRKQRTTATAILVAAGSATRMGGIDKVMATLAGRPLLAHSMLAFQQCVHHCCDAAGTVLFCGGDGAAVWRL